MLHKIEVKRAMWQIPFSGAAAAFPWHSYQNGIVFHEYAKIKQFMSQIDLDNGGWHPGAMELNDQYQQWEYKKNWANDMDQTSKKADLMYLRSADKNYAIGVITNKTYNIQTAYDFPCQELPQVDEYDHLREKEVVFTGYDQLFVNGLRNGKYYINYFFPDNQSVPFLSDDQNGPSIRLNTFLGKAENSYICLFTVRRTGSNWLPQQEDSISEVLNEKLKEFAKTLNFKMDTSSFLAKNNDGNLQIFPNPTSDSFTMKTSIFGSNVFCKIMSTEGKEIKKINLDKNELTFHIGEFEKGIYHVLIFENDTQMYHQKIIKL